jgi:hypothetical protein
MLQVKAICNEISTVNRDLAGTMPAVRYDTSERGSHDSVER